MLDKEQEVAFEQKCKEHFAAVSRRLNCMVGVFVTAKLKGRIDPRQGWITKMHPLTIVGQSGKVYECEGTPAIVSNPPKRNPNK